MNGKIGVTQMDKFEELMHELSEMSEEERSAKIKELEVDCVCPICPTFNQCAKEAGENIFCIRGKSNCIETQKGCICPNCTFAFKYKIGVLNNFYCINGGELERRD